MSETNYPPPAGWIPTGELVDSLRSGMNGAWLVTTHGSRTSTSSATGQFSGRGSLRPPVTP